MDVLNVDETEKKTDIESDNLPIQQENPSDDQLEKIDYKKIIAKKKLKLFNIRIFDFFASTIGLILLLPLFMIISTLILFTSKGEIFFKQVRIGKNGKKFKILKFRTMVKNAESKGLQLSTSSDARITKVGKILRKTKVDELPQLINVFKGEMSLVGPRPEVPKYVEMYNDEQRNVLLVRPGITDIASIEYRDENSILEKAENAEDTYINEVMPQKLELNLEYIKSMSLFFNIKLILKTIHVLKK